MKRKKINLQHLQNAEHFELHADVLALATEITPVALKSIEQCAEYKLRFRAEDDIMKQIRASAVTVEIAAADHARDTVWHGLATAHAAAMVHFDPAQSAAAHRLAPVFKTYSGLAGEAHAKESADIYNLLQELATHHADDVELLGLVPWVAELDRRNIAVETLMRERYGEEAARPAGDLRAARLVVDAAFYALVERVEALSIVEGGAVYEGFIGRLNAILERASNIVAARRGRAAAAKAKEEAKKPTPEPAPAAPKE